MDKLELLHHIFPKNIQDILEKAPITYYKLQEVRLRVNEPLIIIYDNKEYLFGKDGRMERQCKLPYIVVFPDFSKVITNGVVLLLGTCAWKFKVLLSAAGLEVITQSL